MPGAGDDRLARQLGTMQEEQQADGQVGQPAKIHRTIARARQDGGDQNHPKQSQGEIVE